MDKSPDAFRTISEVAEDLDVPQHVLRFWETRFAHIKPLKRGGGRRYYRPDDIDLLRGIRHLLYGEGYTIKGVQRILKEEGVRFVQSIGRGDERAPAQAAGGAGHETDGGDEAAAADPADETLPDDDASLGHPGKGAGAALGRSDIDRLRSALHELVECKRVLGALAALDEPAGPDQALD